MRREMYLSGTKPSLPLSEPIHQSVETCFRSSTASPFRILNSRMERALKSYCAVAINESASVRENKKRFEKELELVYTLRQIEGFKDSPSSEG